MKPTFPLLSILFTLLTVLTLVSSAPHIDERVATTEARTVAPGTPGFIVPPNNQCLFGNLINGNCVCASGCIEKTRICNDPFGRCSGAGKSSASALGGLVVVVAAAVAGLL